MYQILCEDEIIHTEASPVCSDLSCPCHDTVMAEIAMLKRRVTILENAELQRNEDAERIEELRRRHPRTCACDRCLRIRYGAYHE